MGELLENHWATIGETLEYLETRCFILLLQSTCVISTFIYTFRVFKIGTYFK